MTNLIIMILIGSAVGVLFMNATNPPMLSNFFVFAFATIGLIAFISYIRTIVRGIRIKKRSKLMGEGAS